MKHLLQIEWKKISTYRTFWVLAAMYVGFLALTFFGVVSFIKIKDVRPFSAVLMFPIVWHNLTYVAHFFNILLGILIIILTTNEFAFRTHRQNVIDGLSRTEFVLSKIYLTIMIAGAASVVVMLMGFISGFFNTYNITWQEIFSHIYFIPVLFLQMCGYMLLALMIAFLLRRSGLSIGLYLLYLWIVDPVIAFLLRKSIGDYFPGAAMSSLIDNPAKKIVLMDVSEIVKPENIALTIIYSAIMITVSLWVIRKKDL